MNNTAGSPTARRGGLGRVALGVLVSLAAILVLLLAVDEREVAEQLRRADYRYLPLVILLFFAALFTRALGWRTILQEKISLGRAFWTLNEGFLLNNVLPFRLGEVGRAFLLNQTAGLSFWEVLPTIFIERSFDLGITAVMLLASLPYVVGGGQNKQVAFIAGGLVLLGLAALFLVARNQSRVLATFEKLAARWPRLLEFGRAKIPLFLDGLSALTDLGRFLRVVFWLLLTWILTVGWFYVLLIAFIPQAELLWVFFGLGVMAMGVSVPSSPGQLGVFELVWSGALVLLGVDESLAAAYAIVAHAVFIGFTVVLGAYALARDGQSLGQLYRRVQAQSAG